MSQKVTKYRQVQDELRYQIQQDLYRVGDLLPSEHELCARYAITRTTARKALDELQREGYIVRRHGKGSVVVERRNSLGLLTVKGFSDVAGTRVKNVMVARPHVADWDDDFAFAPTEAEAGDSCYRFTRIRCVGDDAVLVEVSWLACGPVPEFDKHELVGGSFFKTLSQRYQIDVLGSEQNLQAIAAQSAIADLLSISAGSPLLYIAVRYLTNKPDYYIYSKLYCNTNKYPIGNQFLNK